MSNLEQSLGPVYIGINGLRSAYVEYLLATGELDRESAEVMAALTEVPSMASALRAKILMATDTKTIWATLVPPTFTFNKIQEEN